MRSNLQSRQLVAGQGFCGIWQTSRKWRILPRDTLSHFKETRLLQENMSVKNMSPQFQTYLKKLRREAMKDETAKIPLDVAESAWKLFKQFRMTNYSDYIV